MTEDLAARIRALPLPEYIRGRDCGEYERFYTEESLRALLNAAAELVTAAQAEVPAGFVLVPIKPTQEMALAYAQCWMMRSIRGLSVGEICAIEWAAMLSVIPKEQING